ncbi:MAG: SUMF1/EgtB/PvdO family nonheme iron enzyme [Caldilineaceae bacterium]
MHSAVRNRSTTSSWRPFEMQGAYPVTNAQYARFVAATDHRAPDHWQGGAPPDDLRTHPVVNVS